VAISQNIPQHSTFISASKKSVPACTALMEKFTRDVEAGKEKAEGWPSAAYAVSKAGEIAFTKAIAQEEEKKGRGVLVNACCPGYVNTDMSKGNGTKTVDQGAKTPVLLALGEINGTTGGFWQSERIIEW
jgi:carbonyl reductase 1